MSLPEEVQPAVPIVLSYARRRSRRLIYAIIVLSLLCGGVLARQVYVRTRLAPPTLAPLPLRLPRPPYYATPRHFSPSQYRGVDLPGRAPRPPYLALPGAVNLARDKPVTASDREPIIGELKMITDGDKECVESSYVELSTGPQWVQIDLGQSYPIEAIVVWHGWAHLDAVNGVVIQVCDDPDFAKAPITVFDNDTTTPRPGRTKDRRYVETYEGRLIPTPGVKGRYVRLHSTGTIQQDFNAYTEVEVWGHATPSPKPPRAPHQWHALW